MSQNLAKLFDSFLDGFTGAGLFGKLRRPGAPTVFVDTRTVDAFSRSMDVISPLDGLSSASRRVEDLNTTSQTSRKAAAIELVPGNR